MKPNNQVLIPTVPLYEKDLATSWALTQGLVALGYARGLMLVLKKGLAWFTQSNLDKMGWNLAPHVLQYGDQPIVIMLSNLPIGDIDFLRQPDMAMEHIRLGLNLVQGIQIGGRRIVTFHLNSLVGKEEFGSRKGSDWRAKFESDIMPLLSKAAKAAARRGLSLMVETVPVPEFCDSVSFRDEETRYHGALLRDLRNPFYLSGVWGFEQIRQAGLGICLDLCHTRTLSASARRLRPSVSTEHLMDPRMPAPSAMVSPADYVEAGLFADDLDALANRWTIDDVRLLGANDLIHLNDGDGLYTTEGGTFREGVPLGEGELSQNGEIHRILRHVHELGIPMVLECDEGGDFVNRPGTTRSIEWLKHNT
jgi:hypothetical protein